MIYYYHNNFLVCNLAEWIIKKKRHGIINGFVRLDGGKDSKHGGQNTAAHLYGFIILYCSFASLPVFLSIIIIILLFPCHVCLFLSDSVCCIPPPPHWIPLNMMNRPLDGASEADSPCDWISSHWFKKKKQSSSDFIIIFIIIPRDPTVLERKNKQIDVISRRHGG